MGVIDRIRKALFAPPGQKDTASSWDSLSYMIGSRTVGQHNNDLWADLSDRERQQAYRIHAIVHACIRTITGAFLEAELYAERRFADGTTERIEHPMVNILRNPNPEMSEAEFMDYHLAHLLTTGKSFIWEWRDGAGRIKELWPLPTSWVRVVPLASIDPNSTDRLVKEYILSVPGQRPMRMPPQDVTYVRLADPTSFHDGLSPLEACYRDYAMDVERMDYLGEMLQNMTVPGLVMTAEDQWSDMQRAEVRERMRSLVGRGSRGAPLILSGGKVNVEAITPLSDLDFPGLSSMSESHICAAFGIPPLLVHARVAQENSPLSAPSLDAAEKVFYRGTMQSLWTRTGDAFTRGFVTKEAAYAPRVAGELGDVVLGYDLSQVRVFQDDLSAVSEQVGRAIRAGIMQINEGRERMGLEADERFDGMYLVPKGMMYVDPKVNIPGVSDFGLVPMVPDPALGGAGGVVGAAGGDAGDAAPVGTRALSASATSAGMRAAAKAATATDWHDRPLVECGPGAALGEDAPGDGETGDAGEDEGDAATSENDSAATGEDA